ncbi:MAG: hypothetical protein LBH68_06120 [Bifidobacteriaceae bacterium]|jgi:antitoxin component of RelBE/YafQ-DinJ toxin-antitoxin module|nr:hypothetical protein [Bifidobacteriaceae bacterium]
MASQSTLTIRIDPETKAAAKARADSLGITLSTVIAIELRRFVNGEPVVIDDAALVPSAGANRARAQALSDYNRGDYVSLDSEEGIRRYLADARS